MTQMFAFQNVGGPPSPGEVLRQKLLEEMQMSQVELARALGISTPRLNMMLKGRCQISAEIALRIERVFGMSPQFWLRVRADFELFEERQRMGNELARLAEHGSQVAEPSSAWQISGWQAAA